ncbi:MAG: hypothetical protein MHM6MM_003983, partial [Cercozoa sp. M6MM]
MSAASAWRERAAVEAALQCCQRELQHADLRRRLTRIESWREQYQEQQQRQQEAHVQQEAQEPQAQEQQAHYAKQVCAVQRVPRHTAALGVVVPWQHRLRLVQWHRRELPSQTEWTALVQTSPVLSLVGQRDGLAPYCTLLVLRGRSVRVMFPSESVIVEVNVADIDDVLVFPAADVDANLADQVQRNVVAGVVEACGISDEMALLRVRTRRGSEVVALRDVPILQCPIGRTVRLSFAKHKTIRADDGTVPLWRSTARSRLHLCEERRGAKRRRLCVPQFQVTAQSGVFRFVFELRELRTRKRSILVVTPNCSAWTQLHNGTPIRVGATLTLQGAHSHCLARTSVGGLTTAEEEVRVHLACSETALRVVRLGPDMDGQNRDGQDQDRDGQDQDRDGQDEWLLAHAVRRRGFRALQLRSHSRHDALLRFLPPEDLLRCVFALEEVHRKFDVTSPRRSVSSSELLGFSLTSMSRETQVGALFGVLNLPSPSSSASLLQTELLEAVFSHRCCLAALRSA